MGYGNKAKFVEGKPNEKRTLAKKRRNFGKGMFSSDVTKEELDKWCQSHDPLFKVKGKERNTLIKRYR